MLNLNHWLITNRIDRNLSHVSRDSGFIWPCFHFRITVCHIDISKYCTIALLVIEIEIKIYGWCCFLIENYLLNWIQWRANIRMYVHTIIIIKAYLVDIVCEALSYNVTFHKSTLFLDDALRLLFNNWTFSTCYSQ